jgi:DTW domain-containing protein YfiP
MSINILNNSVLALRKQQLATSKKEFKARGAKLVRCDHCLIDINECICAGIQIAQCGLAVCMLMYHNESFKPSNTGRLIADVIPENFAFRWDRTEPDEAFLNLINDPQYQPIIVFPADNIEPERVIQAVEKVTDKKTLLIFLDGTWREAKKMIRKSPYLDQFPVLSITPDKLSEYKLRVAVHENHLGTAEVAIMVLELAGEMDAATKLTQHFEDFREAYLKCKKR